MPNINKNIIKQAGAAVANATNKAAGLSASTPEPGTIISAIQLVNGGRKIGPSALAHFTESVRNKLLSLLVSLEPIQDLHGYAKPWPGGGGKNIGLLSVETEGSQQRANKSYANNGVIVTSTGSYGRVGYIIPVTTGETYTVSFKSKYTGSSVQSFKLGDNVNWSDPSYGSLAVTTTLTERSKTFVATSDTLFFGVYPSVSGNVVTVEDFQVELGSTSTAFEPYENICPISGMTGLSVYVGPTSAIGDAATYSMDWTSPAGTVYAGSADIVTGDIEAAPYYASYNGETLVGPWVSSMDEYDPEGTPTTGAQVVDLGGTMTEYHITGQDIITLVGDNCIWSDSGDVTITE